MIHFDVAAALYLHAYKAAIDYHIKTCHLVAAAYIA